MNNPDSLAKGLLFPQQNHLRQLLDASGIWEFQPDPQEIGLEQRWFEQLPQPRYLPVPGTWNETFDDLRNYLGLAWYRKEVSVPPQWKEEQVFIRVGSANYAATVYVNGVEVARHLGGHLPFVAEIGHALCWDAPNSIAIAVENKPLPERVPAGPTPTGGLFAGPFAGYPATTYDFFPYAGLHRSVLLFTCPSSHIDDLTVSSTLEGSSALVTVKVATVGTAQHGKVELGGQHASFTLEHNQATVQLRLPQARLWSPSDPHLYSLQVTLEEAGQTIDLYTLPVGVRTVEVKGSQLLLNGQPLYLTGFGRHEDAALSGRATNLNVLARDYELMRWMGANSFRAAHYPHSEETAQLADRLGILIIAEIPAVSYNFADSDALIEARFAQCQQQLTELIQRDKNHPSVIMWNIANEPMVGNPLAPGANDPHGVAQGERVFTALYQQARTHDPSRPVTLVGVMNGPESWLGITDLVSINRYNGWYRDVGRINDGVADLEQEIDHLHQKFQKPVLFTEFGADTVAGMHAQPAEMWTEEYQTEFMQAYLDLADRKPYVVGMQLWVFADFKTGQGIFRVGGLNHKGVFTRDRRPKMAAHFLRSRWKR